MSRSYETRLRYWQRSTTADRPTRPRRVRGQVLQLDNPAVTCGKNEKAWAFARPDPGSSDPVLVQIGGTMPSAPSTRGPGTFGNRKSVGSRPGWQTHAWPVSSLR